MTTANDDDLRDELRLFVTDVERCAAAHPDGAPEEVVGALEKQLGALSERWIARARAGVPVTLDALTVDPKRWSARGLNERERARHHRKRLDPKRPELRHAIGEAGAWLRGLHQQLRYEMLLLKRTTACDCEAAAAVRMMPKSPMTNLGDWSDGHHIGDKLRCNTCGVLWFRGDVDDDVGGWFFERITSG
jgi:hypothetical protein